MFNLGSVFNAFNSVFGRDLTFLLVKFGAEYVAQNNRIIKEGQERGLEMIRKL